MATDARDNFEQGVCRRERAAALLDLHLILLEHRPILGGFCEIPIAPGEWLILQAQWEKLVWFVGHAAKL